MPDMIDFEAGGGPEVFETPQSGRDPQAEESAKQVIKKFRQARRDRKEISTKWKTYLNFFLGKQRNRLREGWRADVVINYIFGMVQTALALLTDGEPRLTLLPTEPQDVDKVEDFETLVNFYWNKEEVSSEMEKVVLYGLIYGTGIGKVRWNPAAENNMGEVEVEAVSPYYFYIDPGADEIKKARWVIHAEPRPVDWIAETYGVQVAPDFDIYLPSDEKSLDEMELVFDSTLGHTVEDVAYLADFLTGKEEDKTKTALVIELWEKIRMPMTDPNTGQPLQGVFRDIIRRRTVCGLNSAIMVADEPMPEGVYCLPFFAFRSHTRPMRFWGIGDVENLIPIQREYNKRKAQVIEMFAHMAVGRVLIPIESGVDPDSLTNEPGEVIPYNASGGDFKPSLMFPTSPPDSFFRHQEEIKKDLESVAGIYDVTQGRAPKGIQAASAMSVLQEAAQTKIRPKARHLERAIRELGRILLEHFTTYYKVTRYIRILGWDGQPELIPIRMQELLGDKTTIKFDVLCEAGLTMKSTRDEREKKAMELFQAGLIDDIGALEEMMFPRKDAILQRKYGPIGQLLTTKEYAPVLQQVQMMAQQMIYQFQAQMAAQAQGLGQAPPAPIAGPAATSPGGGALPPSGGM